MARCAYCDSDTNLYMNTVPVCRECDEHGYIPAKGTEANGQPRQTGSDFQTGLTDWIYATLVVTGGRRDLWLIAITFAGVLRPSTRPPKYSSSGYIEYG